MKRREGKVFFLREVCVCLLAIVVWQMSSKAIAHQPSGASNQANDSSAKPELVAQLGHSNWVRSAKFSADG
ncbi:MAG: hypothetical protein L0229_05245, partial [Blastocatellia bacterium]|nr:hypothetical protein [Blastocatellia bacterium]